MSDTVATIRKDSPSPSEQPEATPVNNSLRTIIVERRERVGLITLNRPKSLNALNGQLAIETLAALKAFDADDQVGAIVITGSARAFAAGADVAEMAEKPFTNFYMNDFLGPWDEVRSISKPIIAAVGGFALGGGCELAMLCDFIIASEDAQFGLPEVNIGAAEAKAVGLVARVVPSTDLLQVALEAAHTIAGYNAPAVRMAKEAVNRAFEGPLSEGLRHERLLFQAAFATEGQKEGMNAFVNKRAPVFRHR